MKTHDVILTGKTPLLMHHDNIEWSDHMDAWRTVPENKKASKAGDDRTPAWRWIGYLYSDEKHVIMPQANIMRCMMEGGAMVPVPGGRSGKTFKSQTQSGLMCVEPFFDFYVDGHRIAWEDIKALRDVNDFPTHLQRCKEMGFSLLVKRAKVGSSKHIRVRPEFPSDWEARGQITVWDEQVTKDVLLSILQYSGQYKGLGDWRPGGRTPGPYGMFTAEIE